MRKRKALICAAIAVIGSLSVVSHSAFADGPGDGSLALAQGSGGWAYEQVASGAGDGFQAPAYDDSGWSRGQAGFGTTDGACSWNNPTYVKTPWAPDTDMLLIHPFTIPAGATAHITGTVDNNADVYVNGTLLSHVEDGSCGGNGIDVDIPSADLLPVGNNIEIRAIDLGGSTFIDAQISYGFSSVGPTPVPTPAVSPQPTPTPDPATTAISYGSAGWAYNQVATGAGDGFQAPGFDDSSWLRGQAAFGTTDGFCGDNNPYVVKTPWGVGTDLLVRHGFTVPAGDVAHISGTIDNNADVYVNGQLIQHVEDGSCHVGGINADIPASALEAGANELAIRGSDYGGATFLDVTVTFGSALPTPSPTPVPTSTPTPSPTPSATPSPTPTPTSQPTPSASPSPTATPTPAPAAGKALFALNGSSRLFGSPAVFSGSETLNIGANGAVTGIGVVYSTSINFLLYGSVPATVKIGIVPLGFTGSVSPAGLWKLSTPIRVSILSLVVGGTPQVTSAMTCYTATPTPLVLSQSSSSGGSVMLTGSFAVGTFSGCGTLTPTINALAQAQNYPVAVSLTRTK